MLIEETVHQEKLPEVDKIVDQYSVIAKFLNEFKYESPIIFPLQEHKFVELQIKLHELSTGQKFFPGPDIKEFDATFEGRLFTFIKIPNEHN